VFFCGYTVFVFLRLRGLCSFAAVLLVNATETG
jgi:hypothetical protein